MAQLQLNYYVQSNTIRQVVERVALKTTN